MRWIETAQFVGHFWMRKVAEKGLRKKLGETFNLQWIDSGC